MNDVLVTVVGGKGSPGATTTALALAAGAGQPAYMMEADSFGGDLSYRCRWSGLPLAESPTVLTAATAIRHGTADDVLARYSHQFGEQLRVVPGHAAAEQAFTTDWGPLADGLVASRHPVFVDVGRVHSASPTLPLVASAEVIVAVLRADVSSVLRTLDQLERLVPELAGRRQSVPTLVPVLVAGSRHAATLVREVRTLMSGSRVAAAVREVGWIAYDEAGVNALYSGRRPGHGRFSSSAQSLVSQLVPPMEAVQRSDRARPRSKGSAHA